MHSPCLLEWKNTEISKTVCLNYVLITHSKSSIKSDNNSIIKFALLAQIMLNIIFIFQAGPINSHPRVNILY